MTIVEGLYASALALQREGIPPHEIAVRLLERARELGIISIVHRSEPPKLEFVLNGAEHVIGFDGVAWEHKTYR